MIDDYLKQAMEYEGDLPHIRNTAIGMLLHRQVQKGHYARFRDKGDDQAYCI